MVAQDVARSLAKTRATERPPAAGPTAKPVPQTMAFCNMAAVLILTLSVLAYLLFT